MEAIEHEEVPWENLYEDFLARHPRLSKRVIGFMPYDYATIKIYLTDGIRMIFDGNEHIAKFVKG